MSSYGVEVRDWLCGSESCHVTAEIESQNHFSSSRYVFLDTSQWSFVSSRFFEDQQHKLTHWIQPSTIENVQQACSSDEVSKLRKEVADLRKMVSQRSRSPRGKGAGKRSLLAPSQLALPAPPATKGSGKKERPAKVRKAHKVGKISSANSTSPAGITPSKFRSFDQMLSGRSICFLFQSGKCPDSACPRVHCCVGCGKAFKPYNECGCLESTAA